MSSPTPPRVAAAGGCSVTVIDRFDSLAENHARSYLPAGFELVMADADDEEAQVRAVASADYIVVGGVWLRARVIEAARRVRLIQKMGVGVDKIDLAAAARRGIPVAITAGANAASVGEAALLHMLALLRRLLEADAGLRAGRWEKASLAARTYDLAGRTLGIIGLGQTGRQVARRAAAFDMKVTYFDIVRPPDMLERQLSAQFLPLDELLRASDIVTLHVPWTTATHHLMNAARLRLLKNEALLINTSRGEVVDEGALADALQRGLLAGAGLDVFENEPVTSRRPFFDLPNVVLTPHLAGVTVDAMVRMWRHAYRNCELLQSGGTITCDDLVDSNTMRSS